MMLTPPPSTLPFLPPTAPAPLAIVGLACRFPGAATSPAAFWQLLMQGGDALGPVPADRWTLERFYDPNPDRYAKMVAARGGFLTALEQFDAAFFGFSPREAMRLDPQQRLLLELSWEALEDAGLPAPAVTGARAGVFVGCSGSDYLDIQIGAASRGGIDIHTQTGSNPSIVANRVSWFYDWRGPSLVVDTACSSSLTALHLACESLRQGECEMALVGGVQVLLRPEPTLGFSKAGMLSPDGRCKAFDARANGYVRSEGAGVVLVKPLAAALAANDRIYALIRATGINQDGHTNGLTVPSGAAQEQLVLEVCRKAHVAPASVQYVEAHGTGTPVGDPIEAAALGAALTTDRPAGQPLLIGSVKTNLGHLEPASGIAGLLKLALSLYHRQIPPNLHFETPNPAIAFDRLGLQVPTTPQPWPACAPGQALGGVNSFGFGGANAHALLSDWPATETPAAVTEETAILLPLSARSPEAQAALAEAYAVHVAAAWSPFPSTSSGNGDHAPTLPDSTLSGGAHAAHPELVEGEAARAPQSKGAPQSQGPRPNLTHLAYTAGAHRTHHDLRLAIVARSPEELRHHLTQISEGSTAPEILRGQAASGRAARPVFVFSGMGPQWWAMGRQLLATEPVFRAAVERCEALFKPLAQWSLLEELQRDEATSRLGETAFGQPAIFALQVGLCALWRAWGVEPEAVLGHSAGEVAAFYAAGVFSLEEGVRLIYYRSWLQQRTAGPGRMLAVSLSPAAVQPYLNAEVSLAAVNAPASIALAGTQPALEAVAQQLEAAGVFHRFLRGNVAYHSPQMEPIRDAVRQHLGHPMRRPTSVPLYSSVTGQLLNTRQMSPDYWWRNVREPVAFAAAMDALLNDGYRTFLEIGPHPTLSGAVQECLTARSLKGTVLTSLRRQAEERVTLLQALGALYCLGLNPQWEALYPQAQRVSAPTYPWQRERHWHEPPRARAERLAPVEHPLLATRLDPTHPVWETVVGVGQPEWLNDHAIQGTVVFPAAGYLEMARAGAAQLLGAQALTLEEVDLERGLFLPADEWRHLQLRLAARDQQFELASQPTASAAAWETHARGRYGPAGALPPNIDPAALPLPAPPQENAAIYARLAALGLGYGPTFQAIQQLWPGPDRTVARLASTLDTTAWGLHPALLDGCFQTLLAGLAAPRIKPQTFGVLSQVGGASADGQDPEGFSGTPLPIRIERLTVWRPLGAAAWCVAGPLRAEGHERVGDLEIYDAAGRAVAHVEGLRCRLLPQPTATAPHAALLYDLAWVPDPARVRVPPLPLPAPSLFQAALAETARAQEAELPPTTADVHAALLPVATAYIHHTFHALGWDCAPNKLWTTEAFADHWHIRPTQRRFFQRLLEVLAEDGVLKAEAHGWRILRAPEEAPLAAVLEHAQLVCPAAAIDLEMVRRCGTACAAVLRGEADPLELLFPHGHTDFAFQLYAESGSFLRYNHLAAAVVKFLLQHLRLAAPRPLRILEIGGGTGGMTAGLLEVLPPTQRHYVFTDVSEALLKRAAARFAGERNVDYRRFDVEHAPAAQGLPEGSFDLIVASDVLHATQEVGPTLDHCRRLLAPGGWLLALEVTQPARYMDVVFGMLAGWWRFTDFARRPHSALLPFAAWVDILPHHGFAPPLAVPEPFGVAGTNPHTLFLAQATALPPTPHEQAPTSTATWLLFDQDDAVSAAVSAGLQATGASITHIRQPFTAPFETVLPLEAVDLRVVFLWPLAEAATAPTSALPEFALQLIQALAPHPAQLWCITRAATEAAPTGALDEVLENVGHAPLWGLARVAATELPELTIHLLDLPADMQEAAALVLAELTEPDAELEVAWRAGQRYVRRLQRVDLHQATPRQHWVTPTSHAGVRLSAEKIGHLETLTPAAFHPAPPGPGEVQIAVQATGLNFKDVMKVMGLLSDSVLAGGFSGWELGMECAGTICAVGPGVQDWCVGDAVLALARGAFANVVNTSAELVAPKPPQWSFAEAAGLPVAFITAAYGLRYLAHLEAGERVLIHAAAGGVGVAAVQLALRAGAEVLATAGSATKRRWLIEQGVAHVFDSRSVSFAAGVQRWTAGRGVAVILNSLAGEALHRSLGLLAPFGRFVEIGKQDIDANTRIGLRRFQENQAYFAVDIDRLLRARPALGGRLLRELAAEAAAGHWQPLPTHAYPFAQAQDAFRRMLRGQHLGKLVLTTPTTPVRARHPHLSIQVRPNATYLITGGTSGLGLETAAWLVSQGAQRVALVSRRGTTTTAAENRVAAMRAAGATVLIALVDVTDAAAVDKLCATLDVPSHPLRGVVHAAMVLDDGLLTSLTPERWRAVLAPKAEGAWHLHQATRARELDFFLCYSSIANYVGNRGQASYVAANAYLEALVHHRRGQGLPGLVLNWGRLAETGFVARNATVAQLLEQQGFLSLTPAEAVAALGDLLHRDLAQVGVLRMDWARWQAAHPALAAQPRYAAVVEIEAARRGVGETHTARHLQALPLEARSAEIENLILEKLGSILGGALPADRPLTTIGLDSLMAVELAAALETALNLSVPVTKLLQGPTATQLATQLAAQLETAPAETLVAVNAAAALVMLRPGVPGGPLVCGLHAIEGTIERFHALADHLPAALGLCALQAPDNAATYPPFATLEDRAAHYAAAVLQVSAGRPCILLGYSFGGAVALAVAARLQAAGQPPQRIILLDAPAPLPPEAPWPAPDAVREWIEETLLALSQRLTPEGRPLSVAETLQRVGLLPASGDPEPILQRLTQRAEALLRYRPVPVNSPILLLRAATRPPTAFRIFPGATALDFGWGVHVPNLQVQEIPGDHNTVLLGASLATVAQVVHS